MSVEAGPSISPTVSWSRVEPADILSGIRALQRVENHGRILRYSGEGVDAFLAWAAQELESAERATGTTVGRHTTQAVGHARRALDCLFDAYLERDWLNIRVRDRGSFTEKLEMLKKRPGFYVPHRLIPEFVSKPRNKAEHDYVAPSFEHAAWAVEAAEAIATTMIAKRGPLRGPCIAGFFLGGTSTAAKGWSRSFTGFGGPFAFTRRSSDGVVRAGVGAVKDESVADVIYSELSQFDETEHFDLLAWWDGIAAGGGGLYESENLLDVLFQLARLDLPT